MLTRTANCTCIRQFIACTGAAGVVLTFFQFSGYILGACALISENNVGMEIIYSCSHALAVLDKL